LDGGVALIRETAKALARRVPAIDALIRQRDDLLRERHHQRELYDALIRQRDDLLRGRHHQRELYLDLLVKTLTNVIYGDPSICPGQSGFDPKRREVGSDWPSVGHTMVGVARLTSLKQLVQRTLDERIPGDYIEAGVWRGGCCILMRAVLEANQVRDRKVYVADSFAGLPPPKPDQYPVDAGDTSHSYHELAIPIEQVRTNFSTYGLLDDQVVFVPGFFQDTLPTLHVGPFSLIRLDGDMYESTIVALNSLYPQVSPGGFVIIDDYALGGCKAAVDDFRRDHSITAAVNTVDWTGMWWQKP
jgi:O-methyltransferase/8-demethyl-8-(2,3-dimethoxy-alpha-L-rhamnosyl)tetracenomycin-C 4'-O-methyltransferase